MIDTPRNDETARHPHMIGMPGLKEGDPAVLVAAVVLLLLAIAAVSWIFEVGNDHDRRYLAGREVDR